MNVFSYCTFFLVLNETWVCLQIQGHRIKVSTYTLSTAEKNID